jgi:hypothetical protein
VVVDGSLTNACCFAFYVSPFLPSLTVHVVLAGYFASLHPLLLLMYLLVSLMINLDS